MYMPAVSQRDLDNASGILNDGASRSDINIGGRPVNSNMPDRRTLEPVAKTTSVDNDAAALNDERFQGADYLAHLKLFAIPLPVRSGWIEHWLFGYVFSRVHS
ncbi:hypothetical protein FKW77_000646 [Venturia effusa]|uniref:Uncharacterized protein n=1 Tax=Venturia effusa TaxID=50376 RepID=A0A517LPJ8_9PEZI|nr:hypothetical protein FKW77_000646 [Venturia effusa]